MTSRSSTPLYATERAHPLRVVLVGPERVPAWLARMFELTRSRDDIELHAVQLETRADRSRRRLPFGLFAYLWLERKLLRVFLRMHRRCVDGPLTGATLPADMRTLLLDAGTGPGLPAGLGERLSDLRPDLVLCMGLSECAPVLAEAAAHGCWVLDDDLVDPVWAGAALLSPILEGQDASLITLELTSTARLPAQVLSGSWGATRAVSFSQHRDLAFLKLPSMLLRAIRGLPAAATPAVGRLRVGPEPVCWSVGANLQAAWTTLSLLLRSGHRRRKANQPWYVLLSEEGEVLDPEAPRVGSHVALVAPGRNYWADPFLVDCAERSLLFVEEFVDARDQGVIACLELQDDGSALNLGIVLDEPFHVSYPQVFRWLDAWYMTVESYESGRVILYRAADFPRSWTYVSDLVQGWPCVDPTLHHHHGHWYLFVNVSEGGGNPSDELFLFVADALEGPYRPHPANPLVADVRRSRPAGQLFRRDGKLYRPSQCCAPTYGAAVVFNEVLVLGPKHYRERQVSRLDPTWAPHLDGCHTFNAAGGRQVLDVHGAPPDGTRRMRVVGGPAERMSSELPGVG